MTITALSGKDFNVTDMLNEDSLSDLSLYSGMDETDINDDAFDMNKLNSKEKEALGLIQTKLGISIDKLQTYDMDTVAGLMAIARAMDAVEKGTASENANLDAQKDLLKYADNFLGKLYGADPTIMPAITTYQTWVDENKDEFDTTDESELTDGLDNIFETADKAGITTDSTDPTTGDTGTATPVDIIEATVTPQTSIGNDEFASKSMKGQALTVSPTDSVAGDLSGKLLVYTGPNDDRENAELLLNKIIEMYNKDPDFKEQLDKVIKEKGSVNFTVAELGQNEEGKDKLGTALVDEQPDDGTDIHNEILIDMEQHKDGDVLDEDELKDTIAHELLHNVGYVHGAPQDNEIETMIDGK